MVKYFTFDDPIKDEVNILRFSQYLTLNSNYQTIINTRFHNLIHEFNLANTKYHEDQNGNSNTLSANEIRKSYQIPTELQQDLIESKCDSYICVKSGYAEVIPNKFIIDT